MNKSTPKTTTEFDAQNWLFREFLEKMKKNNVASLIVYSKDKKGQPTIFEWMARKKEKNEAVSLISS